MARLNLKLLLLLLVAMVASTWVTYMWKCVPSLPHSTWQDQHIIQNHPSGVGGSSSFQELDCSINGQYHISCRKEYLTHSGGSGEVYVPFSFLEKYYEVYGKLVTVKGREVFEWSHSYSKVYKPTSKYNSSGPFMHFTNYNVEIRDRVKCISASEGVPVSTQWEASGYYYPVQVAQFGLSHYSKNLSDPPGKRRILEDGANLMAKWQVPSGAYVKRVFDEETQSHVAEFNSRDTTGVTLRLKPGMELVMSLNVLFESDNSTLTILVEDRDRAQVFPVSFTCSTVLIEAFNTSGSMSTVYGMGPCQKWTHLTRDLFIDLIKGHILSGRGKKLSRTRLRLLNLTLRGYGRLDNLTISSSDHSGMFYASADWLVRHQDSNGGWPIGVKRKIASGRASDLDPGWYSAMGQGQAMSLLMRAYHNSGNRRYLEAAVNGMRPFSVSSEDGGVRAYFMNQHPFYEEYPTTPPSFVLNGFIYSLIGLYDVLSLTSNQGSFPDKEEERKASGDARLLYDQGMNSLKKLLPLFDTGSGSVYDLRHFTLGLAPNIARWDYHSTHVNQLLLLSTIDPDPILSSTATRWMGYMYNKRAAHN